MIRVTKGVRRDVAAVIDKDLTSAHMARVLGIETLLVLTAVANVAIHFGTPRQRSLGRATLRKIQAYQGEGHFPAGGMGPKIDAAIRSLGGDGERLTIGHQDDAMAALSGDSGTQIVADDA